MEKRQRFGEKYIRVGRVVWCWFMDCGGKEK